MLNPKTEVHPMIWNRFEADRAALGTQYTEEHWDEGSGLSPAVLRAAQAHPEDYATLQVRLCGWNVYFTALSRVEQDEFIRQTENAANT